MQPVLLHCCSTSLKYIVPTLFCCFSTTPTQAHKHQQLRLKFQNSRKQDQPEVSQPAGADQLVPADRGVAQEGAAAIRQLKIKLFNDLICFLGIKY